jgi:flagella basal body P-ring formation protein FlgA
MVSADLSSRGIIQNDVTPELVFDTQNLSFSAEAVAEPIKLISLRYTPENNAFAARFEIAGTDLPVDVTGRIELMIETPHLINARPAGTVLSASDIEMRKVPLKFAESSGYLDTAQIIGKALQHPSRAGMMLKASDIAEPEVIARNQPVTVYFRQGAMTLTVKGKALNDAALGDPVSVLNALSKKVITGVATAGGSVEVKSATLSVAGL